MVRRVTDEVRKEYSISFRVPLIVDKDVSSVCGPRPRMKSAILLELILQAFTSGWLASIARKLRGEFQEPPPVSQYSHLYFYARGVYRRRGLLADLARIVGHSQGLRFDQVPAETIAIAVCEAVRAHAARKAEILGRPEYLVEILSGVLKAAAITPSKRANLPETALEGICLASLNFLAGESEKIGNDWIVSLGKPNDHILEFAENLPQPTLGPKDRTKLPPARAAA